MRRDQCVMVCQPHPKRRVSLRTGHRDSMMTGCSGLIEVVLGGADLADHDEDANDLGVLKLWQRKNTIDVGVLSGSTPAK